jgi:hypothetical protein
VREILCPDARDPEWQAFCRDLYRLVRRNGCRGGEDTRYARWVLQKRGYDAEASLRLYRESGGYCDCEVLFNTAGNAWDEYEATMIRRSPAA